MLTIVGTLAWDTMGEVRALPAPEATGGVRRLHVDLAGGTAGNIATALARLGAPVRLVSAVGRDFAGSPYARALEAAGVDLYGVAVTDEATSRAYIFFDADGRQVTFFHAGASRLLHENPATVSGHVHFAAGEIAAYPRLMRQADRVSFDPGQEMFHRDLDDITACLPLVDTLFVNHHEREVLENDAGWPLERLFAEGIDTVVETRGRDGALVHTQKGRYAVPAVQAVARDPTGAGDAHRAGYLFATMHGADVAQAARFAGVMGACAVETVGAQTNLPTLADAAARYQKTFNEKLPFS